MLALIRGRYRVPSIVVAVAVVEELAFDPGDDVLDAAERKPQLVGDLLGRPALAPNVQNELLHGAEHPDPSAGVPPAPHGPSDRRILEARLAPDGHSDHVGPRPAALP